ncbi:cytochrome P450 2C31 isoform X1 [Chanos chanos]|uniref:Cytochrome P450 2C31 isoform X1 n=1 Tax=Chanos chanos TaxID=29144 RepID=A0A6J2VGD7_CHACN|nr:cytochrome P450 2C31-like isoform X1 [Chanos chanos]
MEIFNTLLLAGLVLLLVLVLRWRRNASGVRLPPGPFALPLVGNLPWMNKHEPFQSFMKWSREYGPVLTVHMGPQRAVVLVGYDTVKEALVDQADDFTSRFQIPLFHRIVRGYGLGISNGERWKQLRRFTLTTLRDFGMGRKRMEAWIQEESKHLLDSMSENKAAPFDPMVFLSRAVSNVICALVFGQRFSYDNHHFLDLLQIISEVLRVGSTPSGQLYNIFPRLMEMLPGGHQTTFKNTERLRSFIMERIEEHKENLNPEDPRDFIDCFLIRLNQEKDNSNTEFHYDNLVATCLNLFLAGTETTSTTIRYALMLLIKYPHIQERMQKEIDTVIGQARSPLMEDRKSLPFTNAVLHEVQRYIDLVPLNVPHYATHNISFRGYTIPKDTVIIPMLHSVLRDENHWQKPWSFNPEHFLDKNGNFKKDPAFLPFSAGKRSCVGESLARMEFFLFMVSLLQHFTFTCPGGPESLDASPAVSSFAKLPRRYELIATPR